MIITITTEKIRANKVIYTVDVLRTKYLLH